MAEKSCYQEIEAACHIVPGVRKQRTVEADTQLAFSSLDSPETKPRE